MSLRRIVGKLAPVVIALALLGGVPSALGANPPGAPAAPAAPAARSWLRQVSSASPSRAAGGTSWSYGKIGVVALLIGLGTYAWYRRRRTGRLAPAKARLAQLQVVAVTRLGPKAQVVVVRVGSRLILLGATDTSINSLGWLDGADEPDAGQEPESSFSRSFPEDLAGDEPEPEPQGHLAHNTTVRRVPRFRELLGDAIGLGGAPKAASPTRRGAAADAVAEQTADRYTRATAGGATARGRATGRSSQLVNVEGQAAGLLHRLNRKVP